MATAPTVSTSTVVTTTEFQALAAQINAESVRRGQTQRVPTSGYTGILHPDQYNKMVVALDQSPYSYQTGLANVTVGTVITSKQINDLITQVNAAAGVCLCNCNYCTCNCNYCTCNCNYCTCNCNYCTCNCNYCTCNCNYACTCNCNYSDERLKENITFIETKEGVNVYSWTYVWDKLTTYVGVIAQELVGTRYENALSTDAQGYYMVDYSKLPVEMARG